MIDGQIHDINLVAQVVDGIKKKIETELEIKLEEVSIAAAGRFLRTCEARADISLNGEQEIDKEIVRSVELCAVKKGEEEVNKNTAGKLYCVGYSVKGYYLNSFVISNLLGHKGEDIGVDVIATFLPRSVIDSLYTVMNKVGLKVMNLTLEPIAAIEAVVPKNLRLLNIALVDIGAGTSDIAISSKETISSYAMVPMAGDEVTEVIAQEYLVDFNAGEEIKRKINISQEITYTDILGLENTVSCENLRKLIDPTVSKIAEAIATKITEINGGKSPAAVFLVGGGAHTPGLLEKIAANLNMPIQRIAIKDRTSVPECVSDNNLGSAGVTVLGIALTAIRSLGNDFINVELNGDAISLFNSHKHTVMDVLLQAGINPSLLIGKSGKNIRFVVNDKKRLAFGCIGQNAGININGIRGDIESEIKEGDSIKVNYAQNGNDACPKVSEIIEDINSISIYVDAKIINLEPICTINEEIRTCTEEIKDGDQVRVFIPSTVLLLKKYVLKSEENLFKDDEEINDEFILEDGIKLYTKDEKEEEKIEKLKIEKKNQNQKSFIVMVNKEEVHLKGNASYIFVDIFNYMSFDLTTIKGNIRLLLNGEKAAYTDKLNEGDEIEVYWD